jgi:uncharacterized protein DUF29
MDRRPLYDEDYFAWLQQQAAALRQLARDRRDLPNDLDIERVAEEIEDVGKSELRAAESFATNLFGHLLLLAFDPHAQARHQWRAEVAVFHRMFRKFITPSMRQLIDLDTVWQDAWSDAQARLLVYGRRLPHGVPGRCPFGSDELTVKDIDWDEAARRVVDVA